MSDDYTPISGRVEAELKGGRAFFKKYPRTALIILAILVLAAPVVAWYKLKIIPQSKALQAEVAALRSESVALRRDLENKTQAYDLLNAQFRSAEALAKQLYPTNDLIQTLKAIVAEAATPDPWRQQIGSISAVVTARISLPDDSVHDDGGTRFFTDAGAVLTLGSTGAGSTNVICELKPESAEWVRNGQQGVATYKASLVLRSTSPLGMPLLELLKVDTFWLTPLGKSDTSRWRMFEITVSVNNRLSVNLRADYADVGRTVVIRLPPGFMREQLGKGLQ